jgi:glutamate-1-semialdehyde aminotransferase
MKTAEEYNKQIKTVSEASNILWQSYRDEQRSNKSESEKLARLKVLNKNILSLEETYNYLVSQKRKAERIEAREDAYIKTFKS